MITAGLPEPPGKCLLRVSWAATDGASFTKISSSGTPLEDSDGAKAARAASASAVNTHMRRGARSTRAATRCQIRCPSTEASVALGFEGQ